MTKGWVIRHAQAGWSQVELDPMAFGFQGAKLGYWQRRMSLTTEGEAQVASLVKALRDKEVFELHAADSMRRCDQVVRTLAKTFHATRRNENIYLDDPALDVYWDAFLLKHLPEIGGTRLLREDSEFSRLLQVTKGRIRDVAEIALNNSVIVTSLVHVQLWAGEYDEKWYEEPVDYCCGYRLNNGKLEKFTI